MTKRKAAAFAAALLAAAAVFGLSFFGARMGAAGSGAAQAKATGDEIGTRSIAIPGFEAIQLKAGQHEQSVSFYNPAGNSCYFCHDSPRRGAARHLYHAAALRRRIL